MIRGCRGAARAKPWEPRSAFLGEQVQVGLHDPYALFHADGAPRLAESLAWLRAHLCADASGLRPTAVRMDILGPVSARLSISTDTGHADVFTRLCDVDPQGRSVNICDGLGLAFGRLNMCRRRSPRR